MTTVALSAHTTTSQAASTVVAGYEVPAVADTAYAVPANAVVVSTSGSDANPGTATSPVATIAHAIAIAPSGGTVVVHGGTYRETLGMLSRPVTLQAWPHEQVWVKGSDVVTGFTASAGAWVRTGWNPAICHTCFTTAALDPAYPAAGLPDQVFVDGTPLTQVRQRSLVVAGTFFVDTANQQLVLGSDPTGHTVEATVEEKAVQFNAGSDGSVVRGIGFAHYAAHYNMDVPAAVIANTARITLDHVTVAWSASRAVSILAANAVVTDSTFLYSGATGVHANAAPGLVFERNRISFSNEQHFSIANSATGQIAAMKVTHSRGVLVRDNEVRDNGANGVWFDLSSSNVAIVRNAIVDNAGHGIDYEVSTSGTIAGNVIARNGRDGVKISGSTNTDVWNNTVADNVGAQIGVFDDPRSGNTTYQMSIGNTSDTANVRIVNNIFVAAPSSTGALLNSYDATSPRHLTFTDMVSVDDHNLWARASATTPAYFATWQPTLTSGMRSADLAAFQAKSAREATSIGNDAAASSVIFASPSTDDWGVRLDGPGAADAVTVPSAIATAMGVSPSGLHLGAPLTAALPTPAVVPQPAPSTTVAPATTVAPTTTVPPTTTTQPPAPPIAVHEVVNSLNGDHVYTSDAAQISTLVGAGYTDTGTLFSVPATGSTVPVYQLHSTAGRHIYTAWAPERDKLASQGWSLDGVAFQTPAKATGTVPVFRYYDGATKSHVLTLADPSARVGSTVAPAFYALG